MDTIKVVRTQYAYELENSCDIKVKLRLTLFLPEDSDFYIYPFEDYLADLEVKFNGNDLPLLQYEALSELVGAPIGIEVLRKAAEPLPIPLDQLHGYENFAVIKFPPHKDSYCELVYTWIESIQESRQKSDPLTNSIPLEAKISLLGGTSSLYVDLVTNERFEIEKVPFIYRRNFNSYGL